MRLELPVRATGRTLGAVDGVAMGVIGWQGHASATAGGRRAR